MNIRITNDSVTIDGYVNAVERLSKPLHDRLGRFLERVKVGAFRKALDRNDNVRILLNHDRAKDLGGTKDGNLELNEDAIGLHARATITDKDVIELAKKGNLIGWSFGFKDRDDGVEMTEENGMTVRNLKDLDLYEVSLVSRDKIPAYDGTLVAVRTEDDALNISDISESEIYRTEDAVIERTDDPKTEPATEKEIDYSVYHQMIDEMKGE